MSLTTAMKLTAHESVISPLVLLYLGLIRPNLPTTQLVLFGTPERRWCTVICRHRSSRWITGRLSSDGNLLSLDHLSNLFAPSGGNSLT